MEVKGIRWVGVGVRTDRMSEMRAFATDVLGLRVVGQDTSDFVELGMADGAKLELFGSAAVADGPWLFASNPVVAGFLVDDIEAARDELAGGSPESNCSETYGSKPTATPGSTSARRTGTSTSSPLTPRPRADPRRRDHRPSRACAFMHLRAPRVRRAPGGAFAFA